MPRPWAAETAIGSPRPERDGTRPRAAGRRTESILFAATSTGSEPRRSRSAISWSPGRRPARASTTSTAASASASAARAWSWIWRRELVAVLEVDAAGVDQRQRAAVPVGAELLAVARDPRALVHDRLARLGQAVDQRGLADVRVSDDRDFHGRSSGVGARERLAQA